MTKNNIENRLEAIENKLNSLSDSSYPMIGGAFSSSRDDEIDLSELWCVVWQSKWVIIVTTFVFAVVIVIYARSLPNIYKSEALLAPAEETSSGGLSGLGGLASLAGVNLGSVGSNKTSLAIEVLKSRAFFAHFIVKRDFLIPLMAGKAWDKSTDTLILDSDIYDSVNKKWIGEDRLSMMAGPSMQEGYRAFRERLSVSQNKKTGLVSFGIEFYSPTIAKQWVDWLVEDINLVIKDRDVAEAERSIEYLTNQLEKISITNVQVIFYELIEEQSKIVMFAEVRDEYAFTTVDSAVVPELKVGPKRVIICLIGLVVGGGGAVFFVFALHFIRGYSVRKSGEP